MLGLSRSSIWPGVALLALAIGGCSDSLTGPFASKKSPPPAVLETALNPAKYKSEVADFMRTYLSNPTKVKDAFIGEPVLKPVDAVPHYITCVRYNPRDSANQYTGNETRLAIFLGGHLTQFLPGDEKMCAGLNYQRFPEVESMVP